MRAARSRLVLCTVLGVVLWSTSAAAHIPDELRSPADDGAWGRLYDDLAKRGGFEVLGGVERCVWAAAAHLGDHNEEGYALRKRLTEADWKAALAVLPGTDAAMGAGEAVLYAMMLQIHGDYDASLAYCIASLKVLESQAKTADSMTPEQIAAAQRVDANMMGVAATTGVLKARDRDVGPNGLPAGYRRIGEQMRLVKEIESSAKALGVDSLLQGKGASATGSVGSAGLGSAGTASPVREMTDKADRVVDAREAAELDELFKKAETKLVAYFQFWRGNLQTTMGREDDAFQSYLTARQLDSECRLYWKVYVEREKRTSMLEFTAKIQKAVKKDELNVGHVRKLNDCLLALGQPQKVVGEATRFLKDNPSNSEILAQRARAHHALKDYASAKKDAQAAVEADVENDEGWYVLGLAAQATGDAKAKEHFAKAVAHSSEWLKLHREASAAMK